MKNLLDPSIDVYRDRSQSALDHFGEIGDKDCGRFFIPSTVLSTPMCVIACGGAAGEGWDHVSVSLQYRCPIWAEMEKVKRMFFEDDETVMQLHVPVADHINFNPFVLHLWRPQNVEIPRPPGWMVGPTKEQGK